MILQTNRLTIRPSTVEDASMIHSVLSNPDTMTYFVEGTYSRSQVDELLHQNQTDLQHYSVVIRDTNKVIGKLSFHSWFMKDTYEIGWIIHPDYANQGYMSEAVEAMLQYGFDTLNAHRIIATCQPENIPSKRLCERFMRLEGTFKQCIHVRDDIWWDELFYAVLQEDYKKNNR